MRYSVWLVHEVIAGQYPSLTDLAEYGDGWGVPFGSIRLAASVSYERFVAGVTEQWTDPQMSAPLIEVRIAFSLIEPRLIGRRLMRRHAFDDGRTQIQTEIGEGKRLLAGNLRSYLSVPGKKR